MQAKAIVAAKEKKEDEAEEKRLKEVKRIEEKNRRKLLKERAEEAKARKLKKQFEKKRLKDQKMALLIEKEKAREAARLKKKEARLLKEKIIKERTEQIKKERELRAKDLEAKKIAHDKAASAKLKARYNAKKTKQAKNFNTMIAREKFISDYRKKVEIEKAQLKKKHDLYLNEKLEKKEDKKKVIIKRNFTHVYHIIPSEDGKKWYLRKMGEQKILKVTTNQNDLIDYSKNHFDLNKVKLYIHDKNGKYHLYK